MNLLHLVVPITYRPSAAASDRTRSITTSIRLPQHESERHNEELIALIVAGMQNPVTPVFEVTLAGKGLHDAGRAIARLSKIVHYGTAVVDENLLRVGAMEIYTGHVQLLSPVMVQPPHFVANRSLKASITESSATNTRAPSTRLAASCRNITD